MKYMLLIYANQETFDAWGPEEHQKAVDETEALHADLRASGEFVGAYGVADQENAKVVTVRDGVRVVTDGPYIETKEYLGSFTIVDCENLERALEIAALNPAAKGIQVEVRPIMHESAPDV